MINWQTRYQKLVSFIKHNADGCSILEIGSGPFGISKYINNKVVGLEFDINIKSESPNLTIEYGDVTSLNYSNEQFDIVLCSDVLEHINVSDRGRALSECLRVAKKFVLIQNPTGFPAFESDKFLKGTFNSLNWISPTWLDEHLANGFPSTHSIIEPIFNEGFVPNLFVNEYVFQHLSALLLDVFYSGTKTFSSLIQSKTGVCSIPPNLADVPYSMLYVVDKSKRFSRETHSVHRSQDSVSKNPVCRIYSVFDKFFDFSECFKNIIPFYVVPEVAPVGALRLEHPSGFLESNNNRSSELTAISNIIRRDFGGDIIGFCHYRRYFNLFSDDSDPDILKVDPSFNKNWTDLVDNFELICDEFKDFDIIVATPLQLNNTIEDQYCISHYAQDYYNLFNIIATDYSYLIPSYLNSMKSTMLYGSNMIIGRSEYVKNLFSIVFDVLEKVSCINDVTDRSQYQTRDLAFLSERIFDVVIRYYISQNIRIKFLKRIHLEL